MFRKLFLPNWQHPSATVRRKAIADGKVSQEHCKELALHDSSTAVRECAVQHIESIDVLVELGDQAPTLSACLASRLQQLLPEYSPAGSIASNQLDRAMRLLQAPGCNALAESAVAACVRSAALRHVDDPAILKNCALADKAVEVRRAALDGIDSEALLADIAKASKGRDKTIARQAEQRLAALRERAGRREQRVRLLEELAALDEQTRPLDERIWQRTRADWEQLAQDATSAQKTRFDELLQRLSTKLHEQKQRQEADRAARRARTALIDRLRQLAGEAPDGRRDTVTAALAQLRTEWAQAAPMLDPWTEQRLGDEWTEVLRDCETRLAQRNRYTVEEKAIAEFMEDLDRQVHASDLSAKQIERAEHRLEALAKTLPDDPDMAKALQRPRHLIERMGQQYAEQEARRKTLQATLEQQTHALEEALADKALEPATKAHKAATAALKELGKARPPATQKWATRLRRSEPELRELQAWRNWGNDHAREALIDEAKALIDADVSLEHRAQALKDLRKRWKALGGGGRQVQQYWEAFDAACTAAHAPIKEQRAHEAATRAHNLASRQALCAELEALTAQTNWDEPDWRTVDKQLQVLRRRWRDSGGVTQKAWGEVRGRYDRALQALDQHLVKERRHNFLQRQALVQAAEALTNHPDSRTAVAEARKLRDAWQVTVTSKPGEERRLWQAFNAALDTVFARERAAREDFRAGLDEHRAQAEGLCVQLEDLVAHTGASLRAQQTQWVQAQERFAALGPLPKAAERGLQRRFEQAVEQARRHLENLERELSDQAMQQLVELHEVCEAAEALAQETSPDQAQVDALRVRWEKAQTPPAHKAVVERITARFEEALAIAAKADQAAGLGDLAQNARQRERLCVDLEILRGIDSPSEAQALRQQRQVELLEEALQGGDKDKAPRITQLQLEYLTTGAVAVDRQAPLQTRFARVFP